MCNPHLTKTVDMRAYCYAVNSGVAPVPTVSQLPLKAPQASPCGARPFPSAGPAKRALSPTGAAPAAAAAGCCAVASSEPPAAPRQPSDAPCTKLFNAFIQRAVPRFITANPRTRGMLVELIIRKVEESYPDAFVEYCTACNCGRSRLVPRERIRAFVASKLIEASKNSLVQKQVKAEKRKALSLKVQEANEALRKQETDAAPLKKRPSQVQFLLPPDGTDDETASASSASVEAMPAPLSA